MAGWREYTVADVISAVIDYRGKTPKKLGGEWSDSGYRALSAKNIKMGKIVQLDSIRYVSEEMYRCWMKEEVQKEDILITSEAPFGQIYYWDSDEKIVLSQRLFAVRINELFYPKYIYFYMTSSFFQAELDGRATGTTVVGLRQPELLKCKIFAPEYQEQKRIADILWCLERKVNNNEAINDNLEQQARALYQSIIDGASQSAVLSDFVSIKHGYAFKGDYITFESNNVVLVTPGNFKIGGGFQENKCKYFTSEYPSDYVLCPGDLIVTMTDLSKEADTLGYSALVPDNPERIYLHNQRIGLVQFTNSCLPKDYVYWFLRSYDYHMRIVGSASGSTVKHTSPGRILEQIIPIPQDREEPKLRLLKDINEVIAQNELESSKLSHMRNIILPRLMSGELDVSSLDL